MYITIGAQPGVSHSPPPYLFTILGELYTCTFKILQKDPCLCYPHGDLIFKHQIHVFILHLESIFFIPESCFRKEFLLTMEFLSYLFFVALTLPGSRILSLLHNPSTIHLSKDVIHKESANTLPDPHYQSAI
jgi:hypothetical protein